MGIRTSQLLFKVITHFLLLIGSIVFLFPFFWMISASFKTPSELLGSAQTILPSHFVWDNYYKAFFTSVPLLRNFFNSMFICTSYTILAVFFCSLGGFAFAKYKFPGRNWLFVVMLSTMMIPGVVGIVPSFIIMTKLGLVNTYWAVIIPGAANAFGIFFMRQYMYSIPDDLLDAAKIDGCNDFKLYWRIILPISSPALATYAIITFIAQWNSYMWPLIMLRTPDMYTIVVAITTFPSTIFIRPWGAIMAASTVSVLPLIITFLIFQKRIIAGITLGAIK